jgi:hypothetical protein
MANLEVPWASRPVGDLVPSLDASTAPQYAGVRWVAQFESEED